MIPCRFLLRKTEGGSFHEREIIFVLPEVEVEAGSEMSLYVLVQRMGKVKQFICEDTKQLSQTFCNIKFIMPDQNFTSSIFHTKHVSRHIRWVQATQRALIAHIPPYTRNNVHTNI